MSRIVKDSEKRITQGYGNGHEGIDIGWRVNEEENKVFALTDGTVIQVVDGKERNPGSSGTESYGNFVMIRHNNGLESTYAHLQKGIKVKIGDKVTKDTQIATMGETGNAYGRHLHLRIKKNGSIVDPTPYLTMNFGDDVQENKTPTSIRKSTDVIAKEVVAGQWGNGEDRKKRLTQAGYNYNEVQSKVNSMLGLNNISAKKSVDEVAQLVIQGKYGNQPDRQKKLEAEGYNYREVQNRVNAILKG